MTSLASKGRRQNEKNVLIRALPELGGGFTLARIFCALFLLKEKVSSMVATAERVGKVARIGGWVFFWLIWAMPKLNGFFCFAAFP